MPVKKYALIIGCLLIFGSLHVSMHGTSRALGGTPLPPQTSGRLPITVDNARQLKQVGRIGRGSENDLALSPDHKLIAIASQAGLWLYTVKTPNAQPHLLGGDAQNIISVAFAPDGKVLAAASKQGVQLWDVPNEQPLGQPWGDGGVHLAFHPDGKQLAVSTDTTIQLWDITTRQPIGQPFPGEKSPLAFSADGAWLAGGLRIWDLKSHSLVIELQDRMKALVRVESVAFGLGGTRLAAADDQSVTSWNIKTGGQIGASHPGVYGYPAVLEFDKGGGLQATYITQDFPWTSIQVYDVNTKARLLKFPLGFTSLWEGFQEWQFGPDGRFIVVHKAYMAGSTVLAWNTETLASIGAWADTVPSTSATRVRPDGSISVLTWNQDVEQLWEWKDGKARVILTLHGVSGSEYTPDETGLAVAYNDGTIRVWDVRTGRRRAVLSSRAC